MTSAFFSGDCVVNHHLDVTQTCRRGPIGEAYEINRCSDWILQNNFEKVALQFPDHLLADAVQVVELLELQIGGTSLCILGDTSYGSCCVDEVAAEHDCCDSLVHFGHACLSPTRRLPVLYVFVSQEIDTDHCCEEFRRLHSDNEEKVILMSDTDYTHSLDKIYGTLHQAYPHVIKSTLLYSSSVEEQSQSETETKFSRCARVFFLPHGSTVSNYKIFYVGSEGSTLTNLMMNYSACIFSSYDPQLRLARQETTDINRSLCKRYYMIERAKDADIVGIVAGTLGVSDYLSVIEHLKKIITKAGKKFYLFVMGKLNVPKLANFPEIDVFVLVACPENTLMDSKEYTKPVVTPFEMEHACNLSRMWTGDYVTDFRQLLPGGTDYCAMAENQGVSYDVSLVTGKLRTIGVEEDDKGGASSTTEVANRADMAVATKSAADYLANRSWRGLEQKLGETTVTDAVEGRKGIASAYEQEGELQ